MSADGSHFVKPEPTNVGIRADRTLRDIPCLAIFVIAFVLMLALLGCAFHEGSSATLFYGMDYLGNVCGQGTPQGIDATATKDWSNYKYVWYYAGLTDLAKPPNQWPTFCVKTCPESLSVVDTHTAQGLLLSFFNTTNTINRCIPDVGKYAEQASISSAIAGTNAQAFAMLQADFWVIPVSLIIAMVLCAVWLFILQQFLVPIIMATIAITFAALVLLGGFFLHLSFTTDISTAKSAHDGYLAAGVLLLIIAVLFVCVILYLRKDILIACDIIGEAGNIVKAVPTTLAVPIVTSVAVCIAVVLFTFVAINIYTVQDKTTATVEFSTGTTAAPQLEATFRNTTGTTAVPATTPAATTPSTTKVIQAVQLVAAKWTTWGQWYNFFMFLWIVGFVHAIGYMTIAFCGVFWYWSRPGSDKFSEDGVLTGFKLTMRYHLGTLAFGSLILALVQLARAVLNMLEYRLRAYKEGNVGLRFLLCCAECCLACFERCVKFLNKNAYIVACMTGEGLFPAARHALSLLLPRAGTVGAVSVIGEVILGIGKICIIAGVTALSYLMLSGIHNDDSTQAGKIFILVIVAIVAYFIASIFFNVFAVSIDTLLLSYCYDLEQNNGADRPYFFPDSLSHHVQSSAQLNSEKTQKKQAASGGYSKLS